jgi:aminopeptidase
MRPVKIKTSPEIQKIAKILVEHSTKVKKGERVQINADILARDLVLEVYKQIIQKGAFPSLHIGFEGLSYTYYKNASEEQLKNFPRISYFEIKNTQKVIHIRAPENEHELATINPGRITQRQKTTKKISDFIHDKLRKNWVIFDYPVEDFAKSAGMPLNKYKKFVFEACMPDWNKLKDFMSKVKRVLDKGDKVRIKAKNTDITFSIKGRNAVIGDGTNNMPDGEVFTSPVDNSAEGYITFTYPLERNGVFAKGIRLEFSKGKVIKASARENFRVIDALLKSDEGAKRLGELGIGCNFKIQKFTNHLLFDEKIGGTIHLALGLAFKECKGRNDSVVHADIVKDLRPKYGGGEVWVDNKLLIKDGKFMI